MSIKEIKPRYISEGSIFLLLILVGAAFVYRSVRRQFIYTPAAAEFYDGGHP